MSWEGGAWERCFGACLVDAVLGRGVVSEELDHSLQLRTAALSQWRGLCWPSFLGQAAVCTTRKPVAVRCRRETGTPS